MIYRLFVLCALIAASLAYHHQGSKVLLHDVTTLVFRSGETAHRARSPDVPAMKCTSGGNRQDALPGTITCRNTGWDGDSVTWDCSAELPQGVWLRNADVICEGWSGPGDGYVRTGSCSIEYELDDRRMGRDNYHRVPEPTADQYYHCYPSSGLDWSPAMWFVCCVVIGIFAVGLIAIYTGCAAPETAAPARFDPVAVAPAPRRSRHRRGDVDISSSHVYHHHNDTDCTGARRVNHFHHGPAAAPWSTSTWSAPAAPRARTPSPPPTHTSTVGAKTRDSDTYTSTGRATSSTSWVTRTTTTGGSGTHTSTVGAKSKSI